MFTLPGRTWKDGTFWLIEVPALALMTQGKSKEDALDMIKDAIESLINVKGFSVDVKLSARYEFIIVADGQSNVTHLIALMLKRQRVKNKLSLEDMRQRLGVGSRNTYAQYESGVSMPGITKVSDFLKAMGLQAILTFNIAQAAVSTVHQTRARRHR